ncbi:MAG: hypothetical protein ACK5QC_11515 [Bacteroidota bacterium]|jgi:hypothetical protein
MTTDTLIFKDKIIRNNDLELTFHKDAFWNYNEKPLPIVKYTLTNCKDLNSIKLDTIGYYNDGFTIETRQESNKTVFEMTDIDDVKIKIICDKSEKEEREYNKQDFVDLITEILKQRDNEYDAVALLTKRADDLKQFLNHELDVATRKITQANWLTEDKKHFLLGQQEIIRRVLETMDRK